MDALVWSGGGTREPRISSVASFAVPLPTDLFTGTGARRRTLGQVIFNYSNRAPTFSILFSFTPFSTFKTRCLVRLIGRYW